jgi:hypothetical protein
MPGHALPLGYGSDAHQSQGHGLALKWFDALPLKVGFWQRLSEIPFPSLQEQ